MLFYLIIYLFILFVIYFRDVYILPVEIITLMCFIKVCSAT